MTRVSFSPQCSLSLSITFDSCNAGQRGVTAAFTIFIAPALQGFFFFMLLFVG